MRKVIKILLKLIPTIILLLIVVPLMVSILLTIPAVQNQLLEAATSWASSYLDTRVDVGNINVGAFGKLKFRNIYVEDYQRDTLLFAEKLDIHILKISPQAKQIKIGYGDIEGGVLNLYQTADSTLNIKPIIARLTPETPSKKSMEISFEQMSMSGFDIRISQLKHRNPEYGVDYGDINLLNTSAEIKNLTIDGPTIFTTIKSFSCRERSGFELVDLSGELYLSLGVISLQNTSIESRYSQLDIPLLSIVGASWFDYRDFVERVNMDVEIKNSTLSSDDIAYFAPRLRNWGVTLTELDALAEGEVNDLSVSITHSQFAESSALALEFHAKGLPDVESAIFTAQIKEGTTIPEDIKLLVSSITEKELPQGSQQIVDKISELRYKGSFEGRLSHFTASVDATSALGGVQSTITMDNTRPKSQILSGHLTTENLNVGKILNTNDLGVVTMSSEFKGNIKDLMGSTSAKGKIERVVLRGESYYNIFYQGEMEQSNFLGEVHSRNTGLDFDLSTLMNFGGERGEYDVTLSLKDIDLKQLKLNTKDSLSRLSAQVKALGSGDNINELDGDVTILNGEYTYNDKRLSSHKITLHTQNNAKSKSFELSSDFADVTYRSHDNYEESWDYLRNSLRNYLPALYNTTSVSTNESEDRESVNRDVNNYSMLSVSIKDLTPLSDAFAAGMQISNDSHLNLMYNTSSHDLSMTLRSQYVELNSTLALDINIDATNVKDSLAIYGSIKEMLVGTRQFKDLSVMGGAYQDAVKITAGYSDSEDDASASIGAIAQLSNSPLKGRMASVRLLPSQITQGEQRWDVKARNIEIDKHGLSIDRFRIQNDKQNLTINGLASRSTTDTLRIDMQNFDLSILSSITSTLGYDVEGVTNGDVVVSSALYNMRVEADVLLDSVNVNALPAPPMQISAQWDAKLNQAAISLRDRIKGDTLIRGYYIPSEVKYFAEFNVDSLHLGLLDAPLKGVLIDTKGYADAALSVSGVRRNASLGGHLDIKGLESTIEYTNVKYRIPSARIEVKDNELVCQNAVIYDTLNNSGLLTLRVNLQHLSNIAYRVRMNVDDILALNTTLADNDLFYGKMFATGVIDISGDKRGVNMDITATTMRNSEFFMPISNKTNISTAEFITFVTPQVMVDTTDMLVRRKLLFESDRKARTSGGSNLDITMSLNVTPSADFQLVIDPTVGDVIRGRGEGRINMRINPKANIFDMYGDYTITEGNYLFTLRNIINKRFIINPGSTIQWTGDPLDAILDIDAVYKLKTSLQPIMQDESTRSVPVDCTIKLTDRLMQPDVSFDISLPTADPEQQAVLTNLLNDQEAISRQFFYLMLANSFISESASGGSSSELGVSTTAATGFELLTNQLSNWLSSSNYNVVIRYRPESELTGDELDFGISRSLINNRLLVEVEGNYSNDTSTVGEEESATSNFAGEAYITWLIDRSGALKLKGFTQTIDRFDENQGLQETGIGIYYRESFNNFKDLKAKVKARFSRKSVAIRDEDDDDRGKGKSENKSDSLTTK